MERFVGDWFLAQGESPAASRVPAGALKIAVVGGGPTGLSCAAGLAKLGYCVTVFEALHEAGGHIAHEIPEHHLPKEVLRAEVDGIRGLGVTFRFGSAIGTTVTVGDLLDSLGYRAVYIGAGAGSPKSLDIPGNDLYGVYYASEFLTRVNLLEAHLSGNGRKNLLPSSRVVVVGGDDSALECARTARRVGAEEVAVVCRRSLQELKVRREDVEVALEEGIQFLFLTSPLRLVGDEAKNLRRIECVEIDPGEPDASGRVLPIPKRGTEFQLSADICLVAIGRRPSPILPVPGLDVDRGGRIVVDPETHQTSIPGVFAGGNVTRNMSITAAMGDGRMAARGIHEFVSRPGNARFAFDGNPAP
jgi:glutamate synthase (NADPH/NADH) small chain